MRREDAEARQTRLQADDPQHTYLVRQLPDGDWSVVRIDLPHRSSELIGERGKATEVHEDPRPSLFRQIPPVGPPGF